MATASLPLSPVTAHRPGIIGTRLAECDCVWPCTSVCYSRFRPVINALELVFGWLSHAALVQQKGVWHFFGISFLRVLAFLNKNLCCGKCVYFFIFGWLIILRDIQCVLPQKWFLILLLRSFLRRSSLLLTVLWLPSLTLTVLSSLLKPLGPRPLLFSEFQVTPPAHFCTCTVHVQAQDLYHVLSRHMLTCNNGSHH